MVIVLVWLLPATKVPRGCPSPRWGAEENGKKTGRKLVGRDKGSLTEQQTKGNSNNNDTDKGNTQNKPHDHRAVLPDRTAAEPSRAVSEFPLCRPPPRNPA